MLRFVVMLNPDFGEPDGDPKPHYFETWQEAEGFAIKNKHRYAECFSEEKKIGTSEFWSRYATYNIFADPNK